MFKKILAIVPVVAAIGLVAPAFADPPHAAGAGLDQSVGMAQAVAQEMGNAVGEQAKATAQQGKAAVEEKGKAAVDGPGKK